VGDVSDLTIKVLEKIHREIRGTNERLDVLSERVETGFAQLNERLDQTNGRLDQTNERLDKTNERLDKTNERLDHVIVMIGSHHSKLEDRVDRIERHLGLT